MIFTLVDFMGSSKNTLSELSENQNQAQSKDHFKDNLVIQQKKNNENVIWALPKQWNGSI
jgi:hypothetical protein